MLYICIENKIYSFELLSTICIGHLLFLNCSLIYSTGFRLKLLMSMSSESSHPLGFRVNETVRRSPSPRAKSLHNPKHTLPSKRCMLYIQWYLIKFFFFFVACQSWKYLLPSIVLQFYWPPCFYCKELIWKNWQFFLLENHISLWKNSH